MLSASRRPVLEAAVLLTLGAAAILVEHARQGVEIRLFALAAILLGPAVRRLLVARSRAGPAPAWLFFLEVASFAGFLFHPVSLFGLALASVPGIFLALPRPASAESPDATGAEKALVSFVALGAGTASWLAVGRQLDGHLWLLGLAALLLEAFLPGAPWKTHDVSRRSASFALVLGWSLVEIFALEPVPWLLPHPAKTAAFLLGSLALLSGWTDLGAREVPTPSWPGLARKLFALSAVVNVFFLLAHPFLPPLEERLPLASCQRVSGHEVMAALPRGTSVEVTDACWVSEDGTPLPLGDATEEAIAQTGLGRYRVTTEPAARWSSRDGTNPLTNGRRYELVVHPSLPLAPAGRIAFFVCVVLGLVAWKQGELGPPGASPLAQRLLLVALTLASFAVAQKSGWDDVLTTPDSVDYVRHVPTRPLLYPTFIDAFDRRPGSAEPLLEDGRGRPRPDPDHRLVNVVRAQKVFTGLCLGVLVFAFSGFLSVFWVAFLLYTAAFAELVPIRSSGVGFSIGCVLSEGVNHGLLFLFFAAIVSALNRPGWLRSLAVPASLTLLILNRPANVILVVALGILWLAELPLGWKRATARAAVLSLALLVPLLVVCSFNAARTGRFRLSSMSGWATLSLVLEIATPEDVSSFKDDPELETFVKACLVDCPVKRIPDYTEESAGWCIVTNLNFIVRPTFARVVKVPAGDVSEFYEDDLYTKVARRLMRNHPRKYARLVLLNVSFARYYLTPLALIGLMTATLLYRRTRAWPFLFCAFLTVLPFVSMVPACLVQCPTERYRSQLFLGEVLAPPLLLAVLATLGRRSLLRPS